MINMGSAHQHRSYQRAHLTTRMRATHPAAQPHRPIHHILQPQTVHQRPGRQQPGVGYQPSSSENHLIPVDVLQYLTHNGSASRLRANHHVSYGYCPRSEALSTSIHPQPQNIYRLDFRLNAAPLIQVS